MSKEQVRFPAGSLVEFSEGAYSDYSILGLLVTLKDCNLSALADEYRIANPDWDDEPSYSGFVAWLVSQQHCAPVSYNSVYLGDYGRWEI